MYVTRGGGEGAKKSENFMDVIDGCPLMGRFGFSVILDIIKAALASSWSVNLINELTQVNLDNLI